ncbi:hypothetical protein PP175_12955 [Aneurinibacillus sp. Ricciae_BoGa-3]|nr:hypothetical protein [Aneurinibacillus sp. Ricciae_BoGa-3]WCK52369.1 hypothetical protein PP175_12955 [Aneurinibacillus sp. Ricciae_BoGa-3]
MKELTHGNYIAYSYGQYNPYTIDLVKQEGFPIWRFTTTSRKSLSW